MKQKENPKVFISHASEDRERFVIDFAKKLREKGVDVWFDKWEIMPGDSLVDKIFEEGIKESETFIIILSKNSINKKWVREELNSAEVQKIEKSIKLIPVIIDEDVEVPIFLKHTAWAKIEDLSNYEDKLKQILMAIYDQIEKPPLGERPKFATDIEIIPGFNRTDSIVFKIVGDIIYENDYIGRFLSCGEAIERASKFEIPKEEVNGSLEILGPQGFWEIQWISGGIEVSIITMTPKGFVMYCENFVEDFDRTFKNIVSLILNEGLYVDKEITLKVGCKPVIVDALLDYFHDVGYIELNKSLGGSSQVVEITSLGKRQFRNILEGE